jgi:hypothetical protein
MTAQRWWVRAAARWIARINGVQGQVQMFSLAVTAFSTFSIMLQGFGLGWAIPYLGVGAAVLGIVYTYLYTEGGVWNQVARDRQDMSNNFAAPTSYIRSEMLARALLAGEKGEALSEEEREAMQDELGVTFRDLRDGIEIETVGENDA